MKLAWKIVSKGISFVLFLVFILMLFFVVSSKASGGEPQLFGYQLKSVLSGSMEPGIKTGSIIAVKPGGDMKRFKEGDVITFTDQEENLITHRVTEVSKSGEHVMYTTKGDNNNAADMEPVLSDNVRAEYTGFTLPYIGYFINYAQSKAGSALLLVLPGLFLLGYAFFTIRGALAELEPREKSLNKTG